MQQFGTSLRSLADLMLGWGWFISGSQRSRSAIRESQKSYRDVCPTNWRVNQNSEALGFEARVPAHTSSKHTSLEVWDGAASGQSAISVVLKQTSRSAKLSIHGKKRSITNR